MSKVAAIGNFDGCHIGHQELIKTTIQIAKSKGLKSAVVTFDPHPSCYFASKRGTAFPLMLSTTEQKIQDLKSFGIDEVIVASFDEHLASLEPEEFIELLVKQYQVLHVVTGYNFFFGKMRKGSPETLRVHGAKIGMSYTQIQQITYENLVVSSSTIRELLIKARVRSAQKLLGRPFSLTGIVEHGDKTASKILNLPTANVYLNDTLALPKLGVYAGAVEFENNSYKSIISLGNRPTLNMGKVTLEAHIFDFNQNIYGKEVKVKFLEFIRPERKYDSLEQLKFEIRQDISSAKYVLQNLKIS